MPAHFGLGSPLALGEAIHHGRIPTRRVIELAPVVFLEAASDLVAGNILARLAGEIVALVRAVLDRLELTDGPVEILLGGGMLEAGDPRLLEPVEAGLRQIGRPMDVRIVEAPPIVGSALAALDLLEAVPAAYERVRLRLCEPDARDRSDGAAVLEGR